jgi:hypothetical protein
MLGAGMPSYVWGYNPAVQRCRRCSAKCYGARGCKGIYWGTTPRLHLRVAHAGSHLRITDET